MMVRIMAHEIDQHITGTHILLAQASRLGDGQDIGSLKTQKVAVKFVTSIHIVHMEAKMSQPAYAEGPLHANATHIITIALIYPIVLVSHVPSSPKFPAHR